MLFHLLDLLFFVFQDDRAEDFVKLGIYILSKQFFLFLQLLLYRQLVIDALLFSTVQSLFPKIEKGD